MKIAFAGPFPPFRGGIAQFTARLFKTLIECYPEHEFVPVSFRRLYPSLLFPGTSQMEPPGNEQHIMANRVLDSSNPIHWMSARRFFRNSAFDWIIIQWWNPFFAPALLNSIPGDIRTAAICHNVIPHESFPFSHTLAMKFLNRVNLVVAHSNADLEDADILSDDTALLKLYHPIYDQYLNVDMDRESAREQLNYSDSTGIVLFFGLIRPYKGLHDLIKAMELLPDHISLLIVGECYANQREIEDDISSAGLSDRVRWINEFVPDSDVSLYFNAADIVALPYRQATQSGVAQIALSFCKTLVLTDTGGLSELVDVGVTGFLAEPESQSSIAEAILAGFKLLSDPNLPVRIGKKALSFSWESYAGRLMEQLK